MKLSDVELARAHELEQRRKARACPCWHVVLDDGNVGDVFLEGWRESVDPEHVECVELGTLLERMSRTQRAKLAAGGYAGVHQAVAARRATP